MFLLSLLGMAFVSVMATEEEDELSKKVGSCWLLTIRDIDEHKEEMNQVIETLPNFNKTQIYHKIQMAMIIQCVEKIELDNQIHMSKVAKYYDVVKDFNYNMFKEVDPILTKDEETLLKIIKDLERDLGDMQKKMIIEKRAKQAKSIEDDWQKAWQQKTPVEQPGSGQYFFFIIVMVIVFGGGYLAMKKIKQIDSSKRKK